MPEPLAVVSPDDARRLELYRRGGPSFDPAELTEEEARVLYEVMRNHNGSTRNEALARYLDTLTPATRGEYQSALLSADRTGSRATPDAKVIDAPAGSPVLGDAALYGLAGDIVRAIEPVTEADPVALLTNLLVSFGSAVGPTPHATADGRRHSTNLFVVQVGNSSKSRKGTALARIRPVIELVDPEWAESQIVGGLSSGEGLIHAVRDDSEKVTNEGEPVDPGVEDKRLLVIEEEFASTLLVNKRERNTLSTLVRQAWDGKNLQTLTRTNPLRATGAHISIVGHITQEELTRCLTDTEMSNGFANRFLWVYARRSKELPFGGGEPALGDAVRRLRQALDFGQRQGGALEFDPAARTLWAERYSELSRARPGLIGAIVNRAEAQVLRLSLLYAVLDCSSHIREVHLRAALALWQYAEDSAEYIFGTAIGSPIAEKIAKAIGTDPAKTMDRTTLSTMLGGHVAAAQLDAAVACLVDQGRVTVRVDDTRGRPRTVYTLA
jgi:Protein of unknown function (DUF3987)